MNLFDDIIKNIKEEYNKSKNDIGWRFLTTSKKTIYDNCGIYLITLNPGGKKSIDDHGVASCENGPAYIVEKWKGLNKPGKAKLQIQFKLLFEKLANKYNYGDFEKILKKSLCGYFIPFRSSSYKKLLEKNKSIELGKKIWKRVIKNNIPNLIICIDKKTTRYIKEIIKELNFELLKEEKYPIGWGDYKASVYNYKNGNNSLKILRFPHLSRFSIFGRSKSEKYIDYLFENI